MKEGGRLDISTPADGLTINVDESLLGQAVLNIVRNAADAATSGDALHLAQVWVQVGLLSRGRPIIEISDNGARIDEELAEKYFNHFLQPRPMAQVLA